MFNKILVAYSEKETPTHLKAIEKVRDILLKENKKFSFVMANELKASDFEDIDLVITIGGDGTFIRAASFISSQLILGINSEPDSSEGALTSIKESELGK